MQHYTLFLYIYYGRLGKNGRYVDAHEYVPFDNYMYSLYFYFSDYRSFDACKPVKQRSAYDILRMFL